jgi:rod shape-determining protein MreD
MLTAARTSLLLLILVTLQTTLFADLPVFGARADIMLLFVIAVGLTGGADRGAMWGFIAGLCLDLAVHGTPVGFFALAYTLIGYSVGVLQHGVLRAAWWIPVLSTIVASALGVLALAVIGTMIGQDDLFNTHLLVIAGVVAGFNALLIFPMMRAVRWAIPPDEATSGRLVRSA